MAAILSRLQCVKNMIISSWHGSISLLSRIAVVVRCNRAQYDTILQTAITTNENFVNMSLHETLHWGNHFAGFDDVDLLMSWIIAWTYM